MDTITLIIKSILPILLLIWYAFFTLIISIRFFSFLSLKKVNIVDKKTKYLPTEYGPDVLSYFLTEKVLPEAFSATILNLIKKGALKLEKKDKVFFITNSDSKTYGLTKAEEYLKDFIVNRVKNSGEISTYTLKRLIKDRNLSSYFLNIYEGWQDRVFYESKKYNRYAKIIKNKNISRLIVSGMAIFFLAIYAYEISFSSSNPYIILSMLLPIFVFILINNSFKPSIKTHEAYIEDAKWNAYKNNLKEYSIASFKDEKNLIDDYFVYSLVLGKENKMRKDIYENLKEYSDIEEFLKIKPEFFLEMKSLTTTIRFVTNLRAKKSNTTLSIRRRTEENKNKNNDNQIGDRGIGF